MSFLNILDVDIDVSAQILSAQIGTLARLPTNDRDVYRHVRITHNINKFNI